MKNQVLTQKLRILEDEVNICTKCSLHETNNTRVFRRGNSEALVVLVAEAGGEEEQKQGIPFVGKSGQLLNQAIEELGYNIENDIYILNIIKCRPPNNRRPKIEEIVACHPYLEQQLDLISAKVVITLGVLSTTLITNQVEGITKLRGKIVESNGKIVMPTYHPSFVLRNGGDKSAQYQLFKEDIKLAFDKARELLQGEK